jgi:predicted enzyme related to lactoylglutathione lyase
MPRPVHFEISADDPDRAVDFYQNLFGWKFDKWEGPIEYWLIMTGEEGEPGIDGGLMRRDETGPGTVNTVDVPNIDEYMEKATTSGGKIVQPKMAVPGVGWMCYIQDPDGNVVGLMESDENAK